MIPNLTKIIGMSEPHLRRPIPGDWNQASFNGWRFWFIHKGGLRAMLSTDTLDNGSTWLHLSISHENRLPTWDELKMAKDAFIGRNHEAVQVLPKDEDFVNLHKFCLHLWSPEP